MASLRVYCAGPLFNQSERDEMTSISEVLIRNGYSVFLPHRDGLEFRLVCEELIERGWDACVAGQFLHEAIFALDVYQLADVCDAMVWNLNGRVPDEGAVSEAAIAWTLGKPLIAYHDDARSKISGRMNPLLVGLVDFKVVQSILAIPEAVTDECERTPVPVIDRQRLPSKLHTAIERGEQLWNALSAEHAFGKNSLIADCVTKLFAPASHQKARLAEI